MKSVLFRFQNLACPGLRARVVAAWGQLPRRSPGCWSQEREQASTQEPAPQRRQPVSAGCSCVSVFLGGFRRPVAGVAGAALPSCCVCWWAVSLLRRSRKPRRVRGHSAVAQRDGAGTGGAQTGPATFLDPGGRSREAQRSEERRVGKEGRSQWSPH